MLILVYSRYHLYSSFARGGNRFGFDRANRFFNLGTGNQYAFLYIGGRKNAGTEMRRNFCQACSFARYGVKTRIAIPHTCGKSYIRPTYNIDFLTCSNFSSMSIRAKFHCNSVTDNGYGKSANLTAVYGKEGENADYAKATPSGTMSINIDKDTKASDFFVPQKDYYLTFEEA